MTMWSESPRLVIAPRFPLPDCQFQRRTLTSESHRRVIGLQVTRFEERFLSCSTVAIANIQVQVRCRE